MCRKCLKDYTSVFYDCHGREVFTLYALLPEFFVISKYHFLTE